MKKITIFNISFLFVLICIFVYFKFFSVQEDILYEVNSWKELIELNNKTNIADNLENNKKTTNYKDTGFALEFLNFCYDLAKIEKIQSNEFVKFAWLEEAKTYMESTTFKVSVTIVASAIEIGAGFWKSSKRYFCIK